MDNRLFVRKASLLLGVLVVALAAGGAFGGTTGKLTGRVSDEQGNPLPGANVVLEGIRLGGTTDAEGVYLILSVSPGRYTMVASLVGYANQTQTGVSVAADFTRTLNFTLKETTVELAELTVVAKRPPIEPDKTTSQYVVTAEDIEQLSSIREISDIVALQAGAGLDGLPTLRGSYSGNRGHLRTGTSDVVIMLDGVPMEASELRHQLPFTGINAGAVQEVTVITGGMAAEYGNAIGGVVNVITKEGGKDFHGKAEYRWTAPRKKHWGNNLFDSAVHQGKMKWGDPTWENEVDTNGRKVHERYDYTGVHGHWAEGTGSGPIGGIASFFVSGKYQGLVSPTPRAEMRGFFENPVSQTNWFSSPGNFQGSYKLAWDARDNMKVKLGGIYERHQTFLGTQRNHTRNIFLPEGQSGAGKNLFKNDLSYLSLTHTLSPKTFYEFRLSWFRDARDTTDVPTDQNSPLEGIPAERVSLDADGWFTVDFNRQTSYEADNRQRYGIKFDLTSQVTKGHLVKTGVEMSYHSLWWTWLQVRSNGSPRLETVSQPDEIGEPINPIMTSVYLQDKMEFEGMIVNVGLRYDRWDHNFEPVAVSTGLWMVAPMANSYRRHQLYAPRVKTKPHQKWSPRIGVSHPITADAAIHFSYGVFAQMPSLYRVYVNSFWGGKSSADFNGNGRIDDTELYNQLVQRGSSSSTDLGFESTIEWEVGTDWNFYRDYTASVTTYYRSGTDYVGNWNPYWWDPQKRGFIRTSRTALNNAFEDTKGFELSLRKAFSDNLSFQISFNQQWHTRGQLAEQRTFYIPDGSFIANGDYWLTFTRDTNTGNEVPVPLTSEEVQVLSAAADAMIQSVRAGTALDWDPLTDEPLIPVYGVPGLWSFNRPNRIPAGRTITTGGEIGEGSSRQSFGKVSFVYQTPPTYGTILGDIRVNLIYRIKSGESVSVQLPGQAAENKFAPMQTMTDLAFEKQFRVNDKLRASFLLNMTNLFNQRDVRALSRSNRNSWYRYGLILPAPTNANYRTFGDPQENTRWVGFPRQIEAGFQIMF